MPHEVDIAILGGGCAGLSLAVRLVGAGLSVQVIEPRPVYSADKAWSYWAFDPHPFTECVVKRWSRWRVRSGADEIVRASPGLRYETVDAGAFYAECQRRLHGANDVFLCLGTAAEIMAADTTGVTLDLKGDTAGKLKARHVIDTRPLTGTPRYGQWFMGAEIETETDRFTPETCDLMDFGPAHDHGIDFTYVLPFSKRHALIEATVFAERAPTEADLDRALYSAVKTGANGAAYRVLRREAGMIPMDAAFTDQTDQPNVIPFGVRGGAARPSTGYAFARIQARADEMATHLRRGAAPNAPAPDGPVTKAMDRLFLNVIRRRPDLGPSLFMQLFAQADATRLERFLSGSTAWRDRLAVMMALPTRLFLSHLMRP